MGRDTKRRDRPPGLRRRKASASKRGSAVKRRRADTSSGSKNRATKLAKDLKEALQQQAATAAVLQVINSSPGELVPVFEVMLEKATRLCEARFGSLWIYEGEQFRAAAQHAVPAALAEFTREAVPVEASASLKELVRGQSAVLVKDLADTELYRAGNPVRRAYVDLGGARTLLSVALRKDNVLLGAFNIYRQEVRPFSDKQIALVRTFAAQAVIAMENARLIAETREALEQQTATGEVLKVINSSPGDLVPVFETILEKAHSLCGVNHGSLMLYDGETFRAAAVHGMVETFASRLREGFVPGPNHPCRPLLEGARFAQVPDCAEIDDPIIRAALDLAGLRTVLFIPLRREGTLLGEITAARRDVSPFTEKEIALLESFAAQAVIAMENARLITETREALEQQTATAEVLQVINSSPGDLVPVFERILEKAHSLCGVSRGSLQLYDGEKFRAVAVHGMAEPFADRLRQGFLPGPNHPSQTVLRGARFAQADCAELDDPIFRAAFELAGIRTVLFIPLRKEGHLLGQIAAARMDVSLFTERDIALLENFAAQAVIAMENARLLGELRNRTTDLARSVDELTATGDVLKIISRSSVDLDTVLGTLVETVARLCHADQAVMWRRRGDLYHIAALHGLSEEAAEFVLSHPVASGRGTVSGRAALERRPVHVSDVLKDPEYTYSEAQKLAGYRVVLAIPLLREDALIGIFSIHRTRVDPFTPKEIELASTFADQAVIAIENARLFEELRERQTELARSVDELTATGDVLKIISRSTVDLDTVLETLVETVARLCRADQAGMYRRRQDAYRLVAGWGYPEETKQLALTHGLAPSRGTLTGRVVLERQAIHIPDVFQDPDYTYSQLQEALGYRTLLGIPLLREDALIGIFAIARMRVEPFTAKEIELASSFADQAVIAIENARLFEELRERQAELARSVDELTATGDVLKIISRSSVDLDTVLDTLVETVERLCRSDKSYLSRRYDGEFRMVAARGVSAQEKEFLDTHPIPTDRRSLSGRVEMERRPVHITDVLQDPDYGYPAQEIIGFRTLLGIPLLREETLLGVFIVTRTRVEPFTPKEIELASSFADQAVIAIENARLFEELRERQAELARSVDELTATGDVLKIISRSSVDLETVLDTLVETVARLCGADQAVMFRRLDERYHVVASRGLPDDARNFLLAHPLAPDQGTLSGRVELERRPIQIPDVLQDPEYTYLEGQKIQGYRTMLGIPLQRGDELIGIFSINRTRVEPFTDREIELATTFADQAVIAIENARLFEELRERQAELRVTFDNMGDGVVMFDADARLAAWNRNFQEMLDLPDAFLAGRPSYPDYFRYNAERGEYSADLEEQLSHTIENTRQELRLERTRPDGRVIEVRRNPVPDGGFVMIYADITERKRAEEAIRLARDAAEKALRELQTAQDRLVQTQKLASLGQLTAGIAHEIKNPLNFVNNFSALSAELADELKEALKQVTIADTVQKEVDELTALLKDNLRKVVQHGKRADSIVKNMLVHSREGSGEQRSADVNSLVDESLNLAYHGARAEKSGFNITLERDFDPSAGLADIYPQEITRVFLNLISNGFYAAARRAAEAGDGFEPKLRAMTRNLGDRIEIRIRDNGTGIPSDIREKIFNPFFTTKPAGEGTGLGLSMSHDIVVKQHGGTIDVASEPGAFTEFTITLPRAFVRTII